MEPIEGLGSTPPPPKQTPTLTWGLKDYNDTAYGNAWYLQQAAESIMELLGQYPPVNPKIAAAYKQLLADFKKVGEGAPPSKAACEKFMKAVENFKNLAQNTGLTSYGFTNDMETFNICLPKFEKWVDAGEPKS